MKQFLIQGLTLISIGLAATPPARQAPDDCVVAAPAGQAEPIATVGLAEPVDPAHAPRPTNDSERLLFRQLYETLVRVDCTGRVLPGLAAAWRLDSDRRTWMVTLREDARFSDGTRVSPADVRASWMREVDGSLRPEVRRLVDTVTEMDARTLAIRLHSPRVDMPASLAHPDLAIAKPATPLAWPLGTRAGLVADGRAPVISLTRDNVAMLRVLVAPGDPRDLLDRGVDLLLTRNREALDYAATLPSFDSIPLAWVETHVLLTPGRARGAPMLSDDQREALARDAVRGEARAANGPFWWQGLTECEASAPAAPTRSRFTPRIVYDAGDAVARGIAERFVGLARAGSRDPAPFLDAILPDRPRRTYQRSSGLTGEAAAQARRLGTDAGYVIALDSHPIDPCRDLQLLTADAPWLDPETIVPLVETRLHALVRRGRGGVTAEWDGGLLITAPAPAPGGAAR